MASRVPQIAGVKADQISIYLNTQNLLPAHSASEILRAFNRAFSAYARERTGRRGFRFEIHATGTDSWWVILQAAHEIYNVSKDYPDLVPLFANNLSHTIQILMESNPADVPRYFRELARALGKAGLATSAKVIEIVNIAKIVIDPVAYEMIARPEPRRPRKYTEPDALALENWEGMQRAIWDAGELAKESKLYGTLHKVGGKWYANAEGFHDVLLPLKLDFKATLAAVDGASYEISGNVQHSPDGHPIGIEVNGLSPPQAPHLLT